MKIKYYPDTDTLYIELNDNPIVETRDLDNFILIDVDEQDNVCAMTIERATQQANMPEIVFNIPNQKEDRKAAA
ncbi:MAG: DUF2283 domain-containing protein [Magnetococcales bacterium]|nr:DUF2283 domain-containing protein [Magnetococcales bacterium]